MKRLRDLINPEQLVFDNPTNGDIIEATLPVERLNHTIIQTLALSQA